MICLRRKQQLHACRNHHCLCLLTATASFEVCFCQSKQFIDVTLFQQIQNNSNVAVITFSNPFLLLDSQFITSNYFVTSFINYIHTRNRTILHFPVANCSFHSTLFDSQNFKWTFSRFESQVQRLNNRVKSCNKCTWFPVVGESSALQWTALRGWEIVSSIWIEKL